MRAVLLIIDMLNDFFDRSEVLATHRDRLVAKTNALASGFRARGLRVYWIRQEFAPDLHDAFGEMRSKNVSITIAGTTGCEILPELEVLTADSTLVKKRYSAFFGTNLEAILSELQPEFVVIAGVNTHACVRMTAIDAYQLDHQVLVAADCIASNDPEHHDVTVRYLEGKVARVLSNNEILSIIDAAQPSAAVGSAPRGRSDADR